MIADANLVVPTCTLIDRVWGESAPRSARSSLYVYIAKLRSALSVSDVTISRQSGGYLLSSDPERIDLHRFRYLVAGARTAADDEQAGALLDEALGLWRGEAFAALDTAWLNALRSTLDAERCAVELEQTELLLRTGQHARLLPELMARAGARPLDERICAHLMLALYRCGRTADALECYQRARRRLADEVGTDPGPSLQRLHSQILTADPALAAAPPTDRVARTPLTLVPRQLPPAVRHFTGRRAELQTLGRLAREATGPESATVTCVIQGTAGVGKTALAMHWAHQVAGRFPGGQLYANLQGFEPPLPPRSPGHAISGLLGALGMPAGQIPRDLQAQAGMYRSLLAGGRMLIVLDNARDAEQVRPLLAGGPGCVTIVTSRSQLTSLAVTEGAQLLALDLFTEAEAAQLLTRRLGHQRAAAEPGAVRELAVLCGGLPLALSIAAAIASTRRGLAVAGLAADLRDDRTRLDILDTGDAVVSIRAVFSGSYQTLGAATARMFRLLGVHPGRSVSVPAAARLAAIPAADARAALNELVHAQLLTERSPGQFAVQNLLRVYAAERARAEDDEAELRAAVHRVLDYYLSEDGADSCARQPTWTLATFQNGR